jgi:hypothetical protein
MYARATENPYFNIMMQHHSRNLILKDKPTLRERNSTDQEFFFRHLVDGMDGVVTLSWLFRCAYSGLLVRR